MKSVVKRLSKTSKELKNIKVYIADYKGKLVGINYNTAPNRLKLPENCNLYRYQIRHSDEDWCNPIELSNWVVVNFYGTIISTDELNLPFDTVIKGQKYDTIDIEKDELIEFDNHTTSAYDLLYNKSKIVNDINDYYGCLQYNEQGLRND